MQTGEFKEYSDFDEDFFSENVQFSDVENNSQELIKNLQSTNNRIGVKSGNSPICREVSCNRNVATSKWKEIRLSKLCTVNTTRVLNFQKEQKSSAIFNRNKTCIRKHLDDFSDDSEDFCAPHKKRKKTEEPLEEMSKSQSDMTISSQGSNMIISQESQKEINAVDSQKMTSQESLSQASITSITSLSPKNIKSSQESLGNKLMSIKIIETMNQNVNSEKLKVHNQNCWSNDPIANKKRKIFPERNKFAEKFASSKINASFIRTGRRYDKEQRVIWNIRKRELEVTKRENAVEIREKLLEAREADIQKREDILKARERKTKIKSKLLKCGKKWKKRTNALKDDTNSNSRIKREFSFNVH